MRILAVALCLLASSANLPAEVVPARKVFGQYQQIVWRDTDGLPHNGVYAISQTPELRPNERSARLNAPLRLRFHS